MPGVQPVRTVRPPFRCDLFPWSEDQGEEEGAPWDGILGALTEEDLRQIRFELAWQPLFGGGLRGLGYFDTLQLTVGEASELLELVVDRREREVKAAFRKRGS